MNPENIAETRKELLQDNFKEAAPEKTPKTLKRKILEEQFPAEYLKHHRNGTKAYLQLNPGATYGTAAGEATKILKKPQIQQAIAELLPNDVEQAKIAKRAFAAKTPKIIPWSELHKYWETSLKLKGQLTDKPQSNVNIGLIIEK